MSHLARIIHPEVHGQGRQLISLAKLAVHHLKRRLDKGKTRTSNWEHTLSEAQATYASADVYSSICIHARLMAEAEKSLVPLDLSTATAHVETPPIPKAKLAGEAGKTSMPVLDPRIAIN